MILKMLKRLIQAIVPQDPDYLNLGTDIVETAVGFVQLAATGADAIGAWTEIEDSLAADSLITHLVIVPDVVADEVGTVQIGVGASGSESAVITVIAEGYAVVNDDSLVIPLPYPVKVKAAERISGRNWGDDDTTQMKIALGLVTGAGIING